MVYSHRSFVHEVAVQQAESLFFEAERVFVCFVEVGSLGSRSVEVGSQFVEVEILESRPAEVGRHSAATGTRAAGNQSAGTGSQSVEAEVDS